MLSDPRGPQTLTDLLGELGPLASAATGEQVAGAGDIALVRIPLSAYQSLPAEPMAGKVVLDGSWMR